MKTDKSKHKKAAIYALQALRLYAHADRPLTSEYIAEHLDPDGSGIAIAYAVRVNRMLLEAGLIGSQLMAPRGYILAADLNKTTILEVMYCLDKELQQLLHESPGDTEDMKEIRSKLRKGLLSEGWGKSIKSIL